MKRPPRPGKRGFEDMDKMKRFPIGRLTEHPDNTRKHSKVNIEAIARSLDKHGQVTPVVINKQKQILKGNGTFRAARDVLGWKHIKVIQVDFNQSQELEYAIADNRTSDLSDFDWKKLQGVFQKLETFEEYSQDDSVTGFTQKDLDVLMTPPNKGAMSGKVDSDDEPEPFITIRFEGEELEDLHHLKKLVEEALDRYTSANEAVKVYLQNMSMERFVKYIVKHGAETKRKPVRKKG